MGMHPMLSLWKCCRAFINMSSCLYLCSCALMKHNHCLSTIPIESLTLMCTCSVIKYAAVSVPKRLSYVVLSSWVHTSASRTCVPANYQIHKSKVLILGTDKCPLTCGASPSAPGRWHYAYADWFKDFRTKVASISSCSPSNLWHQEHLAVTS